MTMNTTEIVIIVGIVIFFCILGYASFLASITPKEYAEHHKYQKWKKRKEEEENYHGRKEN